MRFVALGDNCDVVRGSSPRPKGDSRFYGPGVPRLMVSDLTRDGKNVRALTDSLTEEGAKKSRPMQAGDLVIAVSGNPGLPAVVSHDLCIHDGFVGLRNLRENIWRDYLYWFLKAFHAKVGSTAVGAIFKNLTTHQIRKLQIPLPPLPEQKRIAKILDQADALRAKRREAIAKLDTFLQSTFLDMFGDPVTNPKGWEVKKLGEVGTNLDGQRIPLKKADRERRSGKYPYYGASGIIDYVDDFIFEGTCLLVSEDGANLVARATPIAFLATGKYWVNNHAHVLAENGEANLQFLARYLNQSDLSPYLSGTAQPKLNQRQLNNLKIPLPPLQLQQQFADIVTKVETQKQQMRNHLAQLDTLFASLQSRAFNGEL